MAASNLLTLIDDIATLLDDVSVMTKVAAQKTAGVLGDDLALNAEQVIGVTADRELPIVFSVFKGSLINKIILVPAALLLSAFVPWLVTPLLMLGGLFLCFEGFEKVVEKFFPHAEKKHEDLSQIIDFKEFEKTKIKGAVTTDFILSAEIIAITLGVVAQEPLLKQAMVLSTVAIGMTFFVYGLVAGIVKIDDFGLLLMRSKSSKLKATGLKIVNFAPWLMKGLGILGTAAMFLVGGGIIAHGIPFLHHISEHFLFQGLVGIVAGAFAVGLLTVFQKTKQIFASGKN
jgi:predicted DNA repair protein MutK